MLWTLQKYIFREMGKAFLLTAGGLMAVLGLGGGVMNMLDLEGISALQLLKIMALVVPIAGTLTLPIAALFSATVTYGRLSADNELVACRSGGINIHELFLPTVVISLVSATLSFVFINFMIPNMVKNIDQFVASDLPRIIKQRLSSPERLTLNRDHFTLFADTARIDTPDGGTDKNVALDLGGVAFIMMDDDNWTRLGTAKNVRIGFDSPNGVPEITGDMYGLSLYDIKDGRYIDSGHESLGRFSLPRTIPVKVKWLTLGDLLYYQRDLAEYPAVAERIQKLRANISLVLLFKEVERQFRSRGEVQLTAGDTSYVVRSSELRPDPKNGRPLFDGGVEIDEFKSGKKTRTIKSDSVAMLIDRGARKGTAGVYLQANGNVEILDPLAPGGIIRDDRRSLSGFSVPDEIVQRALDYTEAKLLNDNGKSLGLGKEIDEKRAELLERTDKLARDIVGVLHSRLAFSLSVFVLVILGAALGIVFKGSQILVAFGISFVPSLIVIVMNIMGKQMIEKSATPTNGLILIWSGIALVAILDIYVMMRLVRR
ncbi:MAG: LptF/LptG family permease [Planctomycetes bacterium]|nr:LptF/LptG family permease [Planctomycetota bacterium]